MTTRHRNAQITQVPAPMAYANPSATFALAPIQKHAAAKKRITVATLYGITAACSFASGVAATLAASLARSCSLSRLAFIACKDDSWIAAAADFMLARTFSTIRCPLASHGSRILGIDGSDGTSPTAYGREQEGQSRRLLKSLSSTVVTAWQ